MEHPQGAEQLVSAPFVPLRGKIHFAHTARKGQRTVFVRCPAHTELLRKSGQAEHTTPGAAKTCATVCHRALTRDKTTSARTIDATA